MATERGTVSKDFDALLLDLELFSGYL